MIIAFYLIMVGLVVGQLGALHIFPGVTIYLFDIAIFIFWLASLLRIQKNVLSVSIVRTAFLWVIVLFITLCINSVSIPRDVFFTSILYIARIGIYTSLIALIPVSNMHPLFWLAGIYATCIILGVAGFIQLIGFPDMHQLQSLGWDPHYYRLVGTLFDPNYIGMVFVTGFCIGWIFYRRIPSYILYSAQLTLVVALHLTASRSSIIAFIISVLLLGWKHLRLKTAVFILLVFLVLVVVIPKPGGDTLRLDRYVSTVSRFNNWQISLHHFMRNPFIGNGYATGRYILIKEGYISDDPEVRSTAVLGYDSSLFTILASSGIFGLAVFVILFRQVMLRAMGHTGSRLFHSYQAIYISFCVALFAHSFFVNSFFYAPIMVIFWILTAVLFMDEVYF